MLSRRIFLNAAAGTLGVLSLAVRTAFARTRGSFHGMHQDTGLILQAGEQCMAPLPALAPLLSRRNKENSYWYLGHLMSLLLDSGQTGGRYALLRCTERRGLEPPPHTHSKEDETFLILEGEVTYTVGDQILEAKAGDIMFLPKDIQHSFKIKTDTLETLMLLTPGGFENYFLEMSQPAGELDLPPVPQGPPDIARLIATASKYGIKFPAPPAH